MRDPLVPAHIDLRDFPFMPLEVSRLRDSAIVDEISGDEFRAAILLWCASWHQVPAGSLPKDPKQLSKFAGYGRVVSEWEKVAEGALYGWVECSDGRLYHPVIAEKALDAWDKKSEFAGKASARAEQAKAAAEARWGKKDTPSGGGETEHSPRINGASAQANAGASDQHNGSMTGALPKGNRQGEGIDREKEACGDAREVRSRRQPDETEVWVRSLITDERQPVLVDPDVTPIRAILGEPGIVRADVEAGLAAFLAKSRRRAKSWADFDGWIRTAAKERIAGKPAGQRSSDAPTPLPTPTEFRRHQLVMAIDFYRGRWHPNWPTTLKPDHPDCATPEDVLEEARAVIDAEQAMSPAERAEARGYAMAQH
ncbi:DUF1376 domain-containing protein [Methylobacterium sp. SD21]|uniref:DUF1376 domain-containing protein n=1 Tax=Methylobacterium litchii TaxID=3138810 RepID=UPI00313B3ED5